MGRGFDLDAGKCVGWHEGLWKSVAHFNCDSPHEAVGTIRREGERVDAAGDKRNGLRRQ
jgi:hypothetical protein